MNTPSNSAAGSGCSSHALFAVGDEVIADTAIAGYDRNWDVQTYCRKGDALVILRAMPNGWYHVAHKHDASRVFRIRHREISPANATSEGSPPSRIETKKKRNGDSLH